MDEFSRRVLGPRFHLGHRQLEVVLAEGGVGHGLPRSWIARLPLLAADLLITTALIAAQGFNPAESGWSGHVQDLQHDFIGQEGVVGRRGLATPSHAGLQAQVTFQLCHLAVR